MKNRIFLYGLFPIIYIFLELASHFALFGFSGGSFIITTGAVAVMIGCLVALLVSLFKGKLQKAFAIIILLVSAFVFGAVMVYYSIFHVFFMWRTIGLAGDVTAFWREALIGMKNSWYMIAIAVMPLVLYLLFFRKHQITATLKDRLILIGIIVLTSVFTFYNISRNDIRLFRSFQSSPSSFYYQYGINASNAVDIWQVATNYTDSSDNDVIVDPSLLGKTDVMMTEPKVIFKNILEMDEQALLDNAPNKTIASMHKYFLSREASNKNDYTGMFEGKNLIFLTLEGFTGRCISPELTPTLYKLSTEGFVFTQFYDPLWGGSTATGEYANMTGNFYYSASCLKDSSKTFTYSALGMLFKNEGYATYAYHNGNYGYYSRNLSHPNMGYKVFKAVNGGLVLDSYAWPNSDYLMAKATVNEYINSKKPFHAYYMTISGHTYYTFTGNNMASKHRDEVKKLHYSSGVQAYLATQIEVENMLKYLIKKLDAAGKLEDTVFAMCCDHYPYGLSDEELAELYKLPLNDIRGNFEVYHDKFILWSASMKEPITIDKPCSSIDIVPTLANLFGLEFDSRFIIGTDILSDNENIAIINTATYTGGMWNWKTAQGTYYTYKEKFVKSKTCTLTDDEIANYVKSINKKLEKMKKYSYAILDNNYYAYVFRKNGTPRYPVSNDPE